MDGKGAKRRHSNAALRANLARSVSGADKGLGLAPTSRFSQKIATVATVALLAVLRNPQNSVR